MKRKILSVLIIMTMILAGTVTGHAAEKDIVIVYTGDLNGNVTRNMGLAAVTAYVNGKKAETPYVTLVNVGSSFSGTALANATKGEYVAKAMNLAGYDYTVVGEGDLAYGNNYIKDQLRKTMNFSMLSCNYSFASPYHIATYGGTKIGFVGVTDGDTSFAGENFMYSAVQTAVNMVKDAGAKYVVVLGSIACNSSVTAKKIIENTEGINVFINSNSGKSESGTQVKTKAGAVALLTSPGGGLENFGVLKISVGKTLTSQLVTSYNLQDIGVKKGIDALAGEYRSSLGAVVGKTTVKLEAANSDGIRVIGSRETNLGDFVADSYRQATGADVALVEAGGIRGNLPEGEISYDKILNSLAGEDVLRTVKVSGTDLLDALEMSVRIYPNRNDRFLQISGLTFDIQETVPSSVVLDNQGAFRSVKGSYRVTNVKINGKALDLMKEYTLTGSADFISGKTGYTMLREGKAVCSKELSTGLAVAKYIFNDLDGTVGSQYAKSQGRIDVIKLARQSEIDALVESLIDARLAEYKEELDKLRAKTAGEKALAAVKELRIQVVAKNIKTAAGKAGIKVSWVTSRSVGEGSYQVWRSTAKNSGYKKVFTTTKRSYINTSGLKKGTTYYYKVRVAVKAGNGTVYSPWSNKTDIKFSA